MNSWVTGQFSDNDDVTIIAVNPSHITSSNVPTKNILDQYHKSISYYVRDNILQDNLLDSDSDQSSNIVSFRSNLIH